MPDEQGQNFCILDHNDEINVIKQLESELEEKKPHLLGKNKIKAEHNVIDYNGKDLGFMKTKIKAKSELTSKLEPELEEKKLRDFSMLDYNA